MEADMMKLSPEDHMEVLTLLMQMEKLPEFIGTHQEDNNHNPALLSSKNLQHHDASTTPIFPHPSSHSPFLDMDSPILYNGDPLSPVPPLQNNNNSSATEAMFSCNNGRRNSMAEMREMIFRIAAMQPIHIDPESIKPPKRRNVRISKDPQSVAARHRRERISERIRILQRLVPGGTKMDTASMLDEAIHYVKFLKKQVQTLEQAAINNNNRPVIDIWYPAAMAGGVNGHSPINNCV